MATSFHFEREHVAPVVGVDEAGRGPLAGPVVAAAVVLDRRRCPRGIDDSKKLCAEVRERIAGRLHVAARVGVGIADVEEVDRLNIFWATMMAMTRAVEALGLEPGHILVDGNALPRWGWPSRAIVKGDALCRSIAAASIVAKVARDAMMLEYDAAWPGYGWAANKGYATRDHCEALARLGPTPLHRRSFWRVAAHLNPPRNGEGDHDAQRHGGGVEPQGASPVARPLHHPPSPSAPADGPPPRSGEDFRVRVL